MGRKRDAKLVRCIFPAGIECEGHSLVSSGPEIMKRSFPCKFELSESQVAVSPVSTSEEFYVS